MCVNSTSSNKRELKSSIVNLVMTCALFGAWHSLPTGLIAWAISCRSAVGIQNIYDRTSDAV